MVKHYLPYSIRRMLRIVHDELAYGLPLVLSSSWARPLPYHMVLSASYRDISHRVALQNRNFLPKRFIFSHDLSMLADRVSDGNMHPTIKELYIEGRKHTDTTQYMQMPKAVRRYANGETERPDKEGAYWCRNVSDIDRYFAILHDAFEEIQRSGFRSQAELLMKGGRLGNGGVSRGVTDEVSVIIDHDGKLIFAGLSANHRFSIAQLLKARRIPIMVHSIHRDWLDRSIGKGNISARKILSELPSYHPSIEFW